MRTIILHLQVPDDFVEICMKEWNGDRIISKLRIAELYEKWLKHCAFHNYVDSEDFIKENINLVTNKQL